MASSPWKHILGRGGSGTQRLKLLDFLVLGPLLCPFLPSLPYLPFVSQTTERFPWHILHSQVLLLIWLLAYKPHQVLSDLRAPHIQGHDEIEGGLLVKAVY